MEFRFAAALLACFAVVLLTVAAARSALAQPLAEEAHEAQAAQAALRADYETLFLRAEALSARLQFSQREQEILMYVLQGYTRDGIAERLYLSPDTVKSYMSRIYLNVGINSNKALLAKVNEEPL